MSVISIVIKWIVIPTITVVAILVALVLFMPILILVPAPAIEDVYKEHLRNKRDAR